VTYAQPEEALRAQAELDNRVAFGRILHIRPAYQEVTKEKKEPNKEKKEYGKEF